MSDADDKQPSAHGGAVPSESDATSLKPELQGKLGEKLKEVYSEVLNQPVPDRFLDLLAQLDAKDAAKKGGEGR